MDNSVGKPKISFVIVSWNVKVYLENCLASILKHCHVAYEIIIIDNASTDGSAAYIKNKFPSVIIVANSSNNGFAKANNQGFLLAKGEYVFILNPDTLLYPNTINSLLQTFKENENVIAVGPKTYNFDGTIQKTCARLPQSLTTTFLFDGFKLNKFPIIGKRMENKLSFPYSYDKKASVEAVSGAAILIKSKFLKDIGGFYPSYIHCGEDLELCYRINQNGCLIYAPEAELLHYGGKSSEQDSFNVNENAILSIHLYFKRCRGNSYGLLYKFIMLLFIMPIFIFISLFKQVFLINKSEYRIKLLLKRYVKLIRNPLWEME